MDQHPDGAHELTPEASAPRDATATAFRRALDGGAPAPAPGRHDALLAGVEDRAQRYQRHQRRVLAATTTGVAAAAAGVVVVAVLLGSGSGAPPAAAPSPGRATSSATDGTGALMLPQTPVPVPTDGSPLPTVDAGPHAPADEADPLLTSEDVSAFPGTALFPQGRERQAGGQAAVAGACTDQALPVSVPRVAWRGDWLLSKAAPGGPGSGGLVEQVWRWDDAGQAQAALAAVQAEVAGCSAPGAGSEGYSPVTQQDAAAVAPREGSALVLTQTGPNGDQEVQVLMVEGSTLVRLQAAGVSGADSGAAAQALADTARTAAVRAFGPDLAAS